MFFIKNICIERRSSYALLDQNNFFLIFFIHKLKQICRLHNFLIDFYIPIYLHVMLILCSVVWHFLFVYDLVFCKVINSVLVQGYFVNYLPCVSANESQKPARPAVFTIKICTKQSTRNHLNSLMEFEMPKHKSLEERLLIKNNLRLFLFQFQFQREF